MSNRANSRGLDPSVIIFVLWPFDLWTCSSSILGCADQFLLAAGDYALKSLLRKIFLFSGFPPPPLLVSWTEGSNNQVLPNLLSVRGSCINIAWHGVFCSRLLCKELL